MPLDRVPLAVRVWLRVGGLGWLIACAVTAGVSSRWIATDWATPQLRSAFETQAPPSLVVATILGIVIAATAQDPSPEVTHTSLESRAWVRRGRVALVVAVFLGCVALVGGDLATNANNVLTATGEALITARLLGYPLAWMVPGAHAAASALLGASVMGELAPWAWPAALHPSLTGSVLVAMCLALVGIWLSPP